MPITRSYMCDQCAHYMTVVLDADQWDEPAPECPRCAQAQMGQDFRPVAIGGSVRSKAEKITEDILENDYHVSNIHRDHRDGAIPKAEFKGPQATGAANRAHWSMSREVLETAAAMGRQSRIKHGTGLDILQHNLKTGAEPDLIAISKRRAMKIY